MPYPEHVSDEIYWAILTSGLFAATTLSEMKERWSIVHLFDAYDIMRYRQACDFAHAEEAERKQKK